MSNFTKSERITNKKIIETLFAIDKVISVNPLTVRWLKTENTSLPIQTIITVPKRNFKKATERNLLKRRIREAYRLNKTLFIAELKNRPVLISISYSDKTKSEYKPIEAALLRVFDELFKRLNLE